MYVRVMSEVFSKYIYIIIFSPTTKIRNKKNWPLEQKYVLQDLHRKQVHVSSVPRHCVHQYFNSNWRWDRNSVSTNGEFVVNCFIGPLSNLFIYLAFYIAFNTVPVHTVRQGSVLQIADQWQATTSFPTWRPCQEPNPGLRGERRECSQSAAMASVVNAC